MLRDNPIKNKWTYQDVFSLKELDLTSTSLRKNDAIGMHTHDFYEINIVLSGTGDHYINDQSFHIEKGDVFVIPPNIKHGYENAKELYVYHICIHTLFFEKYAKEFESFPSFFMLVALEPLIRSHNVNALFLNLSPKELESTLFYIDEFDSIQTSVAIQKNVLRNVFVLSLLTRFCNYYQNTMDFSAKETFGDYHELITSLKFIFTNYQEKISIDRLAKLANLSRASFIRKFKQLFHIAPGEFIVTYRIGKAKNLLVLTSKSIAEIAHMTGFYDSPHFMRSFQRVCGVSPSNFRKEK